MWVPHQPLEAAEPEVHLSSAWILWGVVDFGWRKELLFVGQGVSPNIFLGFQGMLPSLTGILEDEIVK